MIVWIACCGGRGGIEVDPFVDDVDATCGTCGKVHVVSVRLGGVTINGADVDTAVQS